MKFLFNYDVDMKNGDHYNHQILTDSIDDAPAHEQCQRECEEKYKTKDFVLFQSSRSSGIDDAKMARFFHCKKCNLLDRFESWAKESQYRKEMEKQNICFSCAVWTITKMNDTSDPKIMPFMIQGDHYQAHRDHLEVDLKTYRGFVGFGGSRFNIESLDGKEKVTTNNLWHQGRVPTIFRPEFPDTHRFVELAR
jgi:hypothetical protein